MIDSNNTTRFHMGLAMWAFRGWLGGLYPKGSPGGDFLKLYGARFTAVEGNTTFYAVPSVETVDRWHDEMPDNFRFCPKIPRDLTHHGPLVHARDGALAFIARMMHLSSRLGPMFLQLPPTYGIERIMDLGYFLKDWPRDLVPLAVEVRHLSWFTPEGADRLNRMLERAGVGRVILDTRPVYAGPGDPQSEGKYRKPDVPVEPVVTAPFSIVRYISHPDLERNTPYLTSWAAWIKRQLADTDATLYFFVHCPQEQHSPDIARRFQEMLEARDIPVPPLPWNGIDDSPAQAQLF